MRPLRAIVAIGMSRGLSGPGRSDPGHGARPGYASALLPDRHAAVLVRSRPCSLSRGLLRSGGRYGKVGGWWASATSLPDRSGERAERRAARQAIGDYHEVQLRLLLDERVREGFARLDVGEIDAFELIQRYERSARELWKFCGQTASDHVFAARTLAFWRGAGDELPDWWDAGEPRRRR